MVGIADLHKLEPPHRYKRKAKRCGSQLCVFLIHGTFIFSRRVQRAVLPGQSDTLPLKKHVWIAGYGPTVGVNATNELHYVSAFIFDNHPINSVYVLSGDLEGKANFTQDWTEVGSPVMDPERHIVLGLLSWISNKTYPRYQPMLSLARNREFINEMRVELNRIH